MSTNFGFNATKKQTYFFISYNTEDADRVSEVCSILNKRGLPMWYDQGIPHDSEWEAVIAEKIDHCQEAIFFITKGIFHKARGHKKSQVAPYKEYDLAKRYGKKVLIVTMDAIDSQNDVPYALISWWQEIDPNHLQGVYAVDMPSSEIAKRILEQLGVATANSIHDDITLPIFNSIFDHPLFGDEREFIHVKEYGHHEWQRTISLHSGKQYVVNILFRNDSGRKYSEKEYNYRGIAVRTVMAVDLPGFINAQRFDKISVRISAENAVLVSEDFITLNNEEGSLQNLRFIAGSCRIKSKWNDSVLSSSIFRYNKGTLLGLTKLNGIIPGGDEFAGHVSFAFEVSSQALEEKQMALFDNDGNEYLLKYGQNYIGHNPRKCTIPVPNDSVSSIHCCITLINNGSFSIQDLGATNGTFVNGNKLSAMSKVPIEDGSRLKLGNLEFTFCKARQKAER